LTLIHDARTHEHKELLSYVYNTVHVPTAYSISLCTRIAVSLRTYEGCVYEQVKFTLDKATRVQRGSRGKALLFL